MNYKTTKHHEHLKDGIHISYIGDNQFRQESSDGNRIYGSDTIDKWLTKGWITPLMPGDNELEMKYTRDELINFGVFCVYRTTKSVAESFDEWEKRY